VATSELNIAAMSRADQTRSFSPTARGRFQAGFSLLEMVFATTVLLVGLIGVAQLVPASLLLNQSNRANSSSVVVVQRVMDEMVHQPLTSVGFLDSQNNFYQLGDPTQNGQLVGSPVVMANNLPLIDFSQNVVPGYSLTYTDVNDPTGATWDLRWAVITTTFNGPTTIMNKRFIVGARQTSGPGFVLPVTLDSLVSK
jgi:hypothetical protein